MEEQPRDVFFTS